MRHHVSNALDAIFYIKSKGYENLLSLFAVKETFACLERTSSMKKRFKLDEFSMLVGILLPLLFAGNIASAQNTPNATLSETGIIQLPSDQALSDVYYFDMSQFHLSDDDMTDLLSTKSSEHYSVRALPHLDKGILMLGRDEHPSWSISDWNVYLNTAGTINPILPGAPNQNSND